MNNLKWREHPNLVANGAFKFQHEKHGVFLNYTGEEWVMFKFISVNIEHPIINAPIKDCTLIARSIESLTDEELRNLSLPSNNRKWIGIYSLPAKDFLYLLSIGVWIGSPEGVEYETL